MDNLKKLIFGHEKIFGKMEFTTDSISAAWTLGGITKTGGVLTWTADFDNPEPDQVQNQSYPFHVPKMSFSLNRPGDSLNHRQRQDHESFDNG